MKLTLATVYTSVVSVLAISNMKMVHALQLEKLYEASLPSFASFAETASKSASESFFGRARTLQVITDECKNKSQETLMADPIFNETLDANAFACPTARNAWLDASGVVFNVDDYRNCDQSELEAYCEQNYQWIRFPDNKITCPPNGEVPYEFEVYRYNGIICVVRDESCPSDSVGFTEADLRQQFVDPTEFSECTFEFLEEGHQPPQKPEEAPEVDNLSQECLDEIDGLGENLGFRNATENFDFDDGCEGCGDGYVSGDNTIFVCDFAACGTKTGLEFSEFSAKFEVFGLQTLAFTNFKAICPGNMLFYFVSLWDFVGLSCPSDPEDWTSQDVKAILGGLESCVVEPLEEGDVPPPPPPSEDDAPDDSPPTTTEEDSATTTTEEDSATTTTEEDSATTTTKEADDEDHDSHDHDHDHDNSHDEKEDMDADVSAMDSSSANNGLSIIGTALVASALIVFAAL